jgi:hypothetical protein
VTTFEIQSTTRVFEAPQPQAPRFANFGDQIALLGADVVPDRVAAGEAVQVILYWKGQVEMDVPYTVFVHLLGIDGQVIAGHDSEPVSGGRPTTSWVPGEYVTDPHSLFVPPELSPGEYVIEVGVYDAGAPTMPRLEVIGDEGQGTTDRVIFGPVEVR